MKIGEAFFFLFHLLGGITLFLVGMHMLSQGLRQAAGKQLRTILAGTGRNRLYGVGLGGLLGFLAHSGPGMIMLIGFINAGLISLAKSIPPMIGMNVGTTLSMQMISFHLGDYCYLFMVLGFLMQMLGPSPQVKSGGQALLGFGMLFLGMNTIGVAVEPRRDLIAGWLAHIHGNSLAGMLAGIGWATLITVLLQSSGAVIALCFALAGAGIFTQLDQIFPIVLGAHIGTTSTALIGSLGTSIDARRSAFSHLLFNLIAVALAVAFARYVMLAVRWSSGDLVHQVANLHTLVMLIGTAIVLPASPWFARLVERLTPSRVPPPQPSFLDDTLLEFPEKAIYAAIFELQRITRICSQSLKLTFEIIFTDNRRAIQVVKLNENVIDEIKKAMKEYIAALTRRYLSRRQSLLIQHINQCVADIERIGDHIDELCDITIRRHKNPAGRFNRETLDLLMQLYEYAARVLHLVIESLNPDNPDFQAQAQAILTARDEYIRNSLHTKQVLTDRIANHELPPIIGVFFSEYLSALDRVVRHAKMVALAEKQPFFWIKREKLSLRGTNAPTTPLPDKVDPHDYLDRLHSENFL